MRQPLFTMAEAKVAHAAQQAGKGQVHKQMSRHATALTCAITVYMGPGVKTARAKAHLAVRAGCTEGCWEAQHINQARMVHEGRVYQHDSCSHQLRVPLSSLKLETLDNLAT